MDCDVCGASMTSLATYLYRCPKCGNSLDSSIEDGDILMGVPTVGNFQLMLGSLNGPQLASLIENWSLWEKETRQAFVPSQIELLKSGGEVTLVGPPETWRKLLAIFPNSVGEFVLKE